MTKLKFCKVQHVNVTRHIQRQSQTIIYVSFVSLRRRIVLRTVAAAVVLSTHRHQ